MRLHEIFSEDRALDFDVKRAEIPTFTDPKISKPIGTFDGYEIRGERFNETMDAYGVFDDGSGPNAVIFLDSKEENIAGRAVNRVAKIWADPKMRGKGYATCLLLFLVRKLKVKLYVDSVTNNGEEFIKKLVVGKKMTPIAVKDDKVIDATFDQIFSIPNEIDVILESLQFTCERWLFENPKVSDMRIIRGAPDGEWD